MEGIEMSRLCENRKKNIGNRVARSFETAGQRLTVRRRAVFTEVSHEPRNKTLGRCAAASRPRNMLRGLCSGDRTGPSGFHELWSYVLGMPRSPTYVRSSWQIAPDPSW